MFQNLVSFVVWFWAIACVLEHYLVIGHEVPTCSGIVPMKHRDNVINITDFGGVGDGCTLNTNAFQKAINHIEQKRKPGGTLLYIPSGIFVTGCFNLTSHMTLYLAEGAVIQATEDITNWPIAPLLPSYGEGPRYMSFIGGNGLRDVIITGENGTITGRGSIWWKDVKAKPSPLKYGPDGRPKLLELTNSKDIIVTNVTFKDSPMWTIHPVSCRNLVFRYVTILAAYSSPNTDGIDPDSCTNVCIEDTYIENGDDLVAVKSGWNKPGLKYGRKSSNITVRRLTGTCNKAGIAIGSEMSGGVENVLFEDIHLFKTNWGIHIKTKIGRGGFIKNITMSNIYMESVLQEAIKIDGNTGKAIDNSTDVPSIQGITIKNVWGVNIGRAGSISGIASSTFKAICLSNITLYGNSTTAPTPWHGNDFSGVALEMNPPFLKENFKNSTF